VTTNGPLISPWCGKPIEVQSDHGGGLLGGRRQRCQALPSFPVTKNSRRSSSFCANASELWNPSTGGEPSEDQSDQVLVAMAHVRGPARHGDGHPAVVLLQGIDHELGLEPAEGLPVRPLVAVGIGLPGMPDGVPWPFTGRGRHQLQSVHQVVG